MPILSKNISFSRIKDLNFKKTSGNLIVDSKKG